MRAGFSESVLGLVKSPGSTGKYKTPPPLQTSLPFVHQRSCSGRTGPLATPVLRLCHDGKAVIWGNQAAAARHRRAARALKARGEFTPG